MDGIVDDEVVVFFDGVVGVIFDVVFDCGCFVDIVGIVDDGCICFIFVVVEDFFVVVGVVVVDVFSGVNFDFGFVVDVFGVGVWFLVVVVGNFRFFFVVKGIVEWCDEVKMLVLLVL